LFVLFLDKVSNENGKRQRKKFLQNEMGWIVLTFQKKEHHHVTPSRYSFNPFGRQFYESGRTHDALA
jgi:hypothetical protein